MTPVPDELRVVYSTTRPLSSAEFIDVLRRSTLAERRPVDDADCVESMVRNANLTVTAWLGETLVGVARSVTDFAYCCYLSDLAVDRDLQHRGIGRELLRRTQAELGPRTKLILLSAPAASAYYPKLGFKRHESAWTLDRDHPPAPNSPSSSEGS